MRMGSHLLGRPSAFAQRLANGGLEDRRRIAQGRRDLLGRSPGALQHGIVSGDLRLAGRPAFGDQSRKMPPCLRQFRLLSRQRFAELFGLGRGADAGARQLLTLFREGDTHGLELLRHLCAGLTQHLALLGELPGDVAHLHGSRVRRIGQRVELLEKFATLGSQAGGIDQREGDQPDQHREQKETGKPGRDVGGKELIEVGPAKRALYVPGREAGPDERGQGRSSQDRKRAAPLLHITAVP